MESFVIPILIVVVVAAGVTMAGRALARRTSTDDDAASAVTPRAGKTTESDQRELARQASARLSQEQHRRIYALIAQGQAVSAIKVYKESTGQGIRAARDAVVALAAHPQPHHVDEPASPSGRSDAGAQQPQRFAYRYRAIASRGDVTREVSSNMLNDEIYNSIKSLAANGDPEAAAASLVRHSEISMSEAREFIALLAD